MSATSDFLHDELFDARAVVRAPKPPAILAPFTRGRVIEACHYLRRNGDWLDHLEADAVLRVEARADEVFHNRVRALVFCMMGAATGGFGLVYGVYAAAWLIRAVGGAL